MKEITILIAILFMLLIGRLPHTSQSKHRSKLFSTDLDHPMPNSSNWPDGPMEV